MLSLNGKTNDDLYRVMIVDDHALVRRGIRSLVTDMEKWEVCGEASNGIEALRILPELAPDIVILDISMPSMTGIDVAIEMRKLLPNVEILVLTMHEAEHFVIEALRAGARGYLHKTETEEELAAALKALSRHRPYFSATISETLLRSFVNKETLGDQLQLTPRERQIVKLVAEGKSNKVIANMLNVSVKTVETHRSSAMRKVNANSTAELTIYAVRNNLIEL